MNRWVLVGVGASLAGLAAILLYLRHGGPVAKSAAATRATEEPALSGGPDARAVVERRSAASAVASESSARRVPPSVRDPKLNERLLQAENMRRRIAELGRNDAKPTAPPTPSPARDGYPSMPAPEGDGNQANKPLGQYVGKLLREQFTPVAKSCYEELLSRQPKAAGKLILNVRVVGDTRVGGVVDGVEIDPASTLEDGEFRLCMRESMFAAAFDAPPGDEGELTFVYPLELSPD